VKSVFVVVLSLFTGGILCGDSAVLTTLLGPTPTPALLRPTIVPAKPTLPPASPTPTLGVGATFSELHAGKKVYLNVRVREVTVRSILISDADGIASIPLHELPTELQQAFGYQPAREAISNAHIAMAEHRVEQLARFRRMVETASANAAASAKFSRLLASFGKTPSIRPSVDLRPRFRELSLEIKNQGRRPSCTVFAVVSAYEFENAQLLGQSEKLSEDYLIWATCQTLKRAPTLISPDQVAEDHDASERDMGFSYGAVLESLSVFGIAPQSAMPNTSGKFGEIPAPSSELIRDSSMRRKLLIHYIPGLENSDRLDNIIQALNENVPVPIGLSWPSERTSRNGRLNTQTPIPGYRHAVTLVGYTCPSGEIENIEFIFRNSYGPSWGEGGYGRASFKYLNENLLGAVVFEVLRPDEAVREATQN